MRRSLPRPGKPKPGKYPTLEAASKAKAENALAVLKGLDPKELAGK